MIDDAIKQLESTEAKKEPRPGGQAIYRLTAT